MGCEAEARLLNDDLAPVICGCYGPIVLKGDVKRLALVGRLSSCTHRQVISLQGRGLQAHGQCAPLWEDSGHADAGAEPSSS